MYGLRTDVHFLQGFWDSSAFRYFVGVNCLPVIVVVVWVDRSLLCVTVGGLWRTWSWLCCCSVCVVSSMWELLFSVCAWAFTLVSPTVSFLFAFHWLMRWAFRFLVEGERYFFFGAWLVTSPIFATGYSALTQISLLIDIIEILLKVPLNTITLTLNISISWYSYMPIYSFCMTKTNCVTCIITRV
jgi:hypothetical protein